MLQRRAASLELAPQPTTRKHVEMYQILLAYSGLIEESTQLHNESLWLTPANIPQKVWDRAAAQSPNKKTHSRSSSLSSNSTVDKPTEGFDASLQNENIDQGGSAQPFETYRLAEALKPGKDDGHALEVDGNVHTITEGASGLELGDMVNDFPDALADMSKEDKQIPDIEAGVTEADRPTPGSNDAVALPTTAHCSLCAKNYRFEYDRLQGSFAIRVMSLEPSTDPAAPLRVKLISTNLGQHPEYEALSYVWGDISDTVDIVLNEVEFYLTRNLGDALRRLRLPDKERRLWVDAISINQNFLPERNQQVSNMREIYVNAQQTLIWVGEDADNSHLIFEHIKEWTTYRDDYLAGRTKKNDPWGEAHLNMPTYQGATREAFAKFCLRPYFYRTWVMQEVAVGKKALIICGNYQEEFGLLVRGTPIKMDNIYDLFHGLDARTHVHELHDLGRSSDLKAILRYSGFCGATDPRDKVYGILGIFPEPLLTVDYGLDSQSVFTKFTEAILQQQGNIRFMHWFGFSERHVAGLPSWVPDYSASKPTGVLPRVHHHTHIVTAASKSLNTYLEGMRVDGSLLHPKGSQLDRLLRIGDVLSANADNHPSSASFRRTMQNWEYTATHLCQHKQFSTPVSHAFLSTLTGGRTVTIPWYHKMGNGVLRDLENYYFKDYEVLQAWNRADKQRQKNELGHFERQLIECCYGRRLFVTEKGTMGLAPSDAREGDLLVFFSGGLYPFVLRSLGDGTFAMVGDCYLHEPSDDDAREAAFNEHAFYQDDIYRDVTEWVLR